MHVLFHDQVFAQFLWWVIFTYTSVARNHWFCCISSILMKLSSSSQGVLIIVALRHLQGTLIIVPIWNLQGARIIGALRHSQMRFHYRSIKTLTRRSQYRSIKTLTRSSHFRSIKARSSHHPQKGFHIIVTLRYLQE